MTALATLILLVGGTDVSTGRLEYVASDVAGQASSQDALVWSTQRPYPARMEVAGGGVRSSSSSWQAAGNGVGIAPQLAIGTPDIEAIIAQYEWDTARALVVVACESGGVATAMGSEPPHRFIGLFQIWTGHRWTEAELMDPAINVAAAYELYTRSGWAPWPTCRP